MGGWLGELQCVCALMDAIFSISLLVLVVVLDVMISLFLSVDAFMVSSVSGPSISVRLPWRGFLVGLRELVIALGSVLLILLLFLDLQL